MKGKSLGRVSRPVVPFLLPVRTQRTWWQRLTAWLKQGWRRLRGPRLQIHPPLAPARHKPFPLRPHQQRRQAVFAALDAAPADLTRRQLIAHVRTVTGVGCSEKLITEWRQARPREGGKKRRRVLGLLFCLGLNACALTTTPLPLPAPRSEITISPAPSEAPAIADFPSPSRPPTNPRLLRIKLTLNAPHELQVKVGQQIAAGAVLSDRNTARQRLLVQQAALQSAQQQQQTQRRLAQASLRQLQSLGIELPSTTFAAEHAALQRAETEAQAAQRAVESQQQKLAALLELGAWDVVNALSTTEDQSRQPFALIRQHEEAKLAQARDQQLLARSGLELHKAKLTTAREVRAWEEQKHRIEVTRQWLTGRSQQQQAALEAVRLTAQLAELQLQLAPLAAVRAPFAGTIKRIEWEDMHDEKISVVVYLLVRQ